jgi:hypothetical protein
MDNKNLENIEIIALAKMFDDFSINLTLNQFAPNFTYINSFLNFLKIKSKIFKPEREKSPFEDLIDNQQIEEEIAKLYPIELNLVFDFDVKFNEIYLIVKLCNNYGLKKIYYSNQTGNDVIIGSYEPNRPIHILNKPIEIDKFLNYPIYFSTTQVLSDYFKLSEYFLNNYINRDLDAEIIASNYIKDDYDDYEKDSFEALTDGQLGDYEEWKENGGNLDDL